MVTTGSLAVFPFRIAPLNNIQPFTYRDGTSHLQLLEKLRVYINDTLRVEFNDEMERILTEFNAGIGTQELQFNTTFADFVTEINDTVMAINNRVGPESIQRVTLTTNYEIVTDPAWPNAHPIMFQLTQDATGGRTVTLGPGITGAITLNPAPGAVTEFWLVPDGAGSWRVTEYAPKKATADALAGAVQNASDAATLANAHASRHGFGGADPVTVDRRQIVDKVRDWVRAGLLLAPTQSFRIMFLGDSQTNDGAYEKPTLAPDIWGGGKGYSYRVANLLTKGGVQSAQSGTAGVTTNTQPGAHVWSAAVAGSRSDTYAPAGVISNVAAVQPELVFHMIGTNDHANQSSPDAYRANVKKAITDIWGVSANTRQAVIVPWPRKNPAGQFHPWTEYTNQLRSIADEYKNDARFTLFEHGYGIERTGGAEITPWWASFPDGIHALPSYHRALAEELAGWMGLPSPLAAFGATRAMQGSTLKAGALDDSNPASSLDIHAAPVPRTVTLNVRALATVTGEGDFHIQEFADTGILKLYPFHVQPGPLTNYAYRLQLEIPPNESRYYYLSGTANIGVMAGPAYDQYNQFWAEVTYI